MPDAAADATVRLRPPYALAGIVGLAVLGIYLVTLAPTTQFWDTSEYIVAAKVLGIPHPPGNPLFVLLANVWGMIPLVAGYALRINLLAAVTSALASALLFLVAERFLRDIIPTPQWARLAAAAGGILVGATSFTVWNQSVVNEKVYTLSLLSIAVVLWLAVHWGDQPAGERRDHWLVLIVYLLALSATNHLMGLLAAPALFVYVEAAEAEERFWWRLFEAGLLLAGAAIAAWLFGQWSAGHGEPWLLGAVAALGVVLWFAFSSAGSTATRIVLSVGAAWMAAVVIEQGWTTDRTWLIGVAAMVLAALLLLAMRSGQHRIVLISLAVVAIGVSVWAFLRLRAPLYPPINEGEPTNWPALEAVLKREQYQKGPLSVRQADLVSQYANYIQYFIWQFGRDWGRPVQNALAALFGMLGICGAVRQWQKDRRGALAMTALMGTVILLLVYYLNFKYGFSIRPGEELSREVRERDYFFIASFQLWGIWVALGLGWLLEAVAGAFRARVGERRAWALGAPVLLLALIPLVGNRLSASRAGETFPRDLAWDLLQSTEPYAILITAGDNDTFPLWYMQEVEGVRQDVLLVNLSLANTDWHPRQVKRRPVFPFDTATAIPLYRGQTWAAPTGPAVGLSFQELDALPPLSRIAERSVFRTGGIELVLEPGLLERADLFVLHLIQQNVAQRPIYFSRTTGGYPDQLRLTPYLLGQGLVRKLMTGPIVASDGVANAGALSWVDQGRTDTLLFDVYHAESAARPRPRGWVDPPSEGMLSLYALLYASQAQYLSRQQVEAGGPGLDSAGVLRLQRASDLAERLFRQTSIYRER